MEKPTQLLGQPKETAAHKHALERPRQRHGPRWALASAVATDERGPRVSERSRGGGTAGGAVRRRWLLRRRQWCYYG